MPDYEEMYKILFHAITHAIRNIETQNYGFALELLIQAQRKTEETYVDAGE